jgi:hypothetical protein
MSVGIVDKQTGDRIPTAGMPAIDDALSAISDNPVQNAIITAALANKQDKTDNSLQTTDKTVVGAVNELKSGLTNVDVALSVPENTGKNVLPLTLANLKAINTSGTWSGNAYTIKGVTFTVQTDSDGNVTSIVANGVATNKVWFRLVPTTFDIMNGTILSGITNGSLDTFSMYAFESNDTTVITQLTNGEYTFTNNHENVNMYINILSGVTVDNITFYPMLRPAGTTPTFAPYIPSVESRIEAVESGLTTLNGEVLLKTHNIIKDTLSIVQSADYINVTTDIFTATQNTIINLYLEKDSNTSYRYFIITRGSTTVYRFGSESSYGNIDKLICTIFVPKGETVKLITQTTLAGTTTVKYQLSY